MITATGTDHGPTINNLASQGLIKPISFELDGKVYQANSAWAATDWLKERGIHKEGRHRWLDAKAAVQFK